MSENEVQILREDISEMRKDVKEIGLMLSDMRVSLAGDYVTRKEKNFCQNSFAVELKDHEEKCALDLREHEAKDRSARRWWAGFVISATMVVMAIVNFVFYGGRGGVK